MVVLAIISLVIIAAVCFLGTFSRKYDDNLAQRIGMALLCISAISRVRYLWLMEYVDFEWLRLCSRWGRCTKSSDGTAGMA